MDEHLFALSLFILLVLLAKNHRMLLLMPVGSFNMLRRRIQHTNDMLWQYFFRVQNESLQLHRTAWVHTRPQHYFEELLVNNQLDFQWKLHFRVDRETFEFICHLVAPHIQREYTNFREAVPVAKRVAASLWKLGTGESYTSVGVSFGLGTSTTFYVTESFMDALLSHLYDFIIFPETEEETRRQIAKFATNSDFPQIVGAIDGMFIKIVAPKDDPVAYICRKKVSRVSSSGSCRLQFKVHGHCHWFSRQLHDARVLRLSNIFDRAEASDILSSPAENINGTNVRP